MTGRWRRSIVLPVLLSTIAAVLLPVAPAGAAVLSSSDCDSGVGNRTPIVLVHGFRANERSWSSDTRELLAAPRVRFCTTAFDYGSASTSWVVDPRISEALAGRVLALANASKSAGGSGKVIVVAHSMGGLAIRCAASSSCGGSDAVGPVLRGVVTFDTPNLGSFLKGFGLSHAANVLGNGLSAACRVTDPFDATPVLRGICGQIRALGTSSASQAFTPGSDELRLLPSLPPDVPVLALAGSVRLGTSFWGRPAKVLGDVGDLIVSQDSAFAAAREVDGLGGKIIRDCGILDVTSTLTAFEVIPVLQPELQCTHVSQTNNPDWTVVVTQFVRAVDAKQPRPAVTEREMLSLTLPAGNECGYAADEFDDGVALQEGKAEAASGGFIETTEVLLADLDGDGIGDGLSNLTCSSGAAGTSSALVALLGSSRRVRDVPYGADAEGRLPEPMSVYRLEGMSQAPGVLTLVASGHRPEDSTCCPSAVVTVRYDLVRGGPVLKDAVVAGDDPGAPVQTAPGTTEEVAVAFVTAAFSGVDAGRYTADSAVAAEAQAKLNDNVPGGYRGRYGFRIDPDYLDPGSQGDPAGGCQLVGDITVMCPVGVQRLDLDEADSGALIGVYFQDYGPSALVVGFDWIAD